jgi:hypothetical protein
MTALAVIALCRSRGVQLVPDGGRLLLRGPQASRDAVREIVRGRKLELLAVLREPRTPASDCPGPTWHKDWQGKWVDLSGAHGGRDALPSNDRNERN